MGNNPAKTTDAPLASSLHQGYGMLRRTSYMPILVALASCSACSIGSPSGSGPAADAAPGADVASTAPGADASNGATATDTLPPDVVAASGGPVHAPPCEPGEFLYHDEACGNPTSYDPTPSCWQTGDDWCHAKCTQGDTCANGFSCVEETLCNGSDYCHEPIYICNGPLHAPVGAPCRASSLRVSYSQDCAAPATCTTVTSTDCAAASTCQKTVCAL
jgi:hypothetical protein